MEYIFELLFLNNWAAEELSVALIPLKPQLLRDFCLDLGLLLCPDFRSSLNTSSVAHLELLSRNSGGMSSQPLLEGFLELAWIILISLKAEECTCCRNWGFSGNFCTLFSPVLLRGKLSLNHAETLIYYSLCSLSMAVTSTFWVLGCFFFWFVALEMSDFFFFFNQLFFW